MKDFAKISPGKLFQVFHRLLSKESPTPSPKVKLFNTFRCYPDKIDIIGKENRQKGDKGSTELNIKTSKLFFLLKSYTALTKKHNRNRK